MVAVIAVVDAVVVVGTVGCNVVDSFVLLDGCTSQIAS